MKTTIKYVLAVALVLGVFQYSITYLMKTIKTHEVGKINRILFSDEKFDITNNIKMSLADSLSILSAIAKNEGYTLNDLITVFNQ